MQCQNLSATNHAVLRFLTTPTHLQFACKHLYLLVDMNSLQGMGNLCKTDAYGLGEHASHQHQSTLRERERVNDEPGEESGLSTEVLEFSDYETTKHVILSHRWIDSTELEFEDLTWLPCCSHPNNHPFGSMLFLSARDYSDSKGIFAVTLEQ